MQLVAGQQLGCLGNGHRFAAERRLVGQQLVGFQHARVRRDKVALAQNEQVAADHVLAFDLSLLSVPQDKRLRRAEFFECFDGLLRPPLLINADDRVDEDDGQNNDEVVIGFARDARSRVGGPCGQKQHDRHPVAERAEKGAQQSLALFALKKIFAVALETGLRLRFGQSGGELPRSRRIASGGWL